MCDIRELPCAAVPWWDVYDLDQRIGDVQSEPNPETERERFVAHSIHGDPGMARRATLEQAARWLLDRHRAKVTKMANKRWPREKILEALLAGACNARELWFRINPERPPFDGINVKNFGAVLADHERGGYIALEKDGPIPSWWVTVPEGECVCVRCRGRGLVDA